MTQSGTKINLLGIFFTLDGQHKIEIIYKYKIDIVELILLS